jgi:hypothetical protein
MPLESAGVPLVSDINSERRPTVSDQIKVRREAGAEDDIVAAARSWALAFEAVQRQESAVGESSELALYEAQVGVDELKSAELALYQAVLAAALSSR